MLTSLKNIQEFSPDWQSAFWELAVLIYGINECVDEERKQEYMKKALNIIELCSVRNRVISANVQGDDWQERFDDRVKNFLK